MPCCSGQSINGKSVFLRRILLVVLETQGPAVAKNVNKIAKIGQTCTSLFLLTDIFHLP